MTPNRAVASASLLLLGMEVPPRDLDSPRLKRAFRRMALLAHPDTRRRAGRPERYASLLERPPRREKAAHARAPAARAAGAWYWSGKVPRRPLRLAEFPFYSGVISWDVLIRVIVEQKGSRPVLGQLARNLGLIDSSTLDGVLAERKQGEKLGEALIRLGILDHRTVDRLAAEQRRLQRPMGWHLVRMGCLPRSEVADCLCRLWRHNLTAARES